jgi:hypothetical protein
MFLVHMDVNVGVGSAGAATATHPTGPITAADDAAWQPRPLPRPLKYIRYLVLEVSTRRSDEFLRRTASVQVCWMLTRPLLRIFVSVRVCAQGRGGLITCKATRGLLCMHAVARVGRFSHTARP